LRSRLARSRQCALATGASLGFAARPDEETRRREIERFIEDLHQVAEMLQ
jgi:hypothetical protein